MMIEPFPEALWFEKALRGNNQHDTKIGITHEPQGARKCLDQHFEQNSHTKKGDEMEKPIEIQNAFEHLLR